MSLINPPLSLFLSSSFSPLSSKLLRTKGKIRRISVPFFCTVLYHVRSTAWELFSSFSQTSCAQIQQIFPDAKSGYYWVYIKGKKAQVYCDMDNYGMNALYLSCISLVFVAGFSYWSIQLHPLNLLATWFRQQWMMKTLKFNLFWGRGDE